MVSLEVGVCIFAVRKLSHQLGDEFLGSLGLDFVRQEHWSAGAIGIGGMEDIGTVFLAFLEEESNPALSDRFKRCREIVRDRFEFYAVDAAERRNYRSRKLEDLPSEES